MRLSKMNSLLYKYSYIFLVHVPVTPAFSNQLRDLQAQGAVLENTYLYMYYEISIKDI